MIVAYDANRVIGNHNAMPWQGMLPADMQHFKDLTVGKSVVMGRKTFESIGRPLPYRQNIVLTTQDIEYDNAQVVHSLAHAYAAADSDVFIIGGAEIYAQGMTDADVIYATEIHTAVEGDTFFPALPAAWREITREDHTADEKNKFAYSFVTYAKQQ
jgi:dihydrofolate reductase